MMRIPFKIPLLPIVGLAILPIVPFADATPTISGVSVDGDKITISGSGFGRKTQAAPIMWVFGDDVRLNGKRVNLEKNVAMKSDVPVRKGGKRSLWDRGGGVKFDQATRVPSISHSYRAEKDGWLGWPYAFGGSNTPYSEKAFISWRIKPSGDINSYKEVSFIDRRGSFQTGVTPYDMGESITLTTRKGRKYSGRIVYIDNDKMHVHLAVSGASSKRFHNAKITGDKSGAEMTATSQDFYRSASATKYLRSYETVHSSGTHSTLSTNRWLAVQLNDSGDELRRAYGKQGGRGYGVPDVSHSTDWKLMEAYIDLSGDMGKGYVSANNRGKKWYKGLYIRDSKSDTHGPTISNIGWEAAGGRDSIHAALNFGEIYFDKTPQRVVLSTSNKYSNSKKNQEFQYIKSWDEQKIVVEKLLRSLNGNQPIFLYVFDENNNVNNKGKCISHCNGVLPPSKTDLHIQ